jgi:hypothetical protein
MSTCENLNSYNNNLTASSHLRFSCKLYFCSVLFQRTSLYCSLSVACTAFTCQPLNFSFKSGFSQTSLTCPPNSASKLSDSNLILYTQNWQCSVLPCNRSFMRVIFLGRCLSLTWNGLKKAYQNVDYKILSRVYVCVTNSNGVFDWMNGFINIFLYTHSLSQSITITNNNSSAGLAQFWSGLIFLYSALIYGWLHSGLVYNWLLIYDCLHSQVKVKVTLRLTVSQAASKSWLLFDSHGIVLWGALSDKRTGLSFVMLLTLASAVPWDSRPYFTVSHLRLIFPWPPTTRRVTVELFDPDFTRVVSYWLTILKVKVTSFWSERPLI